MSNPRDYTNGAARGSSRHSKRIWHRTGKPMVAKIRAARKALETKLAGWPTKKADLGLTIEMSEINLKEATFANAPEAELLALKDTLTHDENKLKSEEQGILDAYAELVKLREDAVLWAHAELQPHSKVPAKNFAGAEVFTDRLPAPIS